MNKKGQTISQKTAETVINAQIKEQFRGEKNTKKALEEGFTLQEVVAFLTLFKKGEATEEQFQEFLSELSVKKYLPLEEKAKLMTSLVLNLVYTPHFISEMAAVDLEFRKLFYCLLAYTNIDTTSVDAYPLEFETYDLIIETGVYDYIYSECQQDYQRLEKMIDHAMSFDSMLQVVSNMGQIDTDAMHQQMQEAQSFINQMSKEDKELLASIGTVGDPLVADIAKLVRENKLD